MNKVKINTVDKIIMNQLLPQVDSILVQIMARDVSRKIEITPQERDIIKLRPAPSGVGVVWNEKGLEKTEKEIEFSEVEIRMLQDQVGKLDKQKKISPVMLDTVIKLRDIKIEGKKKPK